MKKDNKSIEQLLNELDTSKAVIRQLKKEKDEFIDSLPVIVFETDVHGTITFINKQFELDMGYTQDDISHGFTIENAVVKDDVQRALDHFRNVIGGREMEPFEGRLAKKDGNVLTVIVYPKAIVRDDEIAGTRGIIINLTNQKQAELSYRILYESSIDGIVHVDMQGKIQKANEAYRLMTGYSEEELRSITYQQLTPSRWQAMEDQIVNCQVKLRGYSDVYEKEYIRKDGTIIQISVRAWLFNDGQGNPEGMWAIVRDITERKQAENSLLESEEKYRVIFNNEIYAICIFDLETLELLDVNNAYVNLYGYSRNELVSGMTIHDITVEHITSDEATQKAVQEGTIFIPLRYHRKKDGTIFPVEIVGGPYSWKGKRVMFALAHDISDRKYAQDRLLEIMKEQQIILDHANIGISMVIDRKQAWVNQKIIEMFQYPKEELEGHSTRKLYPTQEAYQKLGLNAYPVLASGQNFETEQQLVRKDGSAVWVKFNGRAVAPPDLSKGTIWLLEDITEWKRIEQSLKESEEKYRRIFENDIMAVCIFDYETYRFIDMNEAHVKLYGYSKEELMNDMTAFDLTAEYDASTDSVKKIFNEWNTMFIPLRYHRKKDGTVFPVEIVGGTCLLNSRPVIFAIVRDISIRLQMEEDLRKSVERLDLALKATRDALWDWDLVSGRMFYSRRWWNMLGYENNELESSADLWRRLMHPDDVKKANDIAENISSKEGIFEIEVRLMHKDGHYIPVYTRGGILRDSTNKPIRIFGTNTDLTERKRAEAERNQWEYQKQQVQKAESLNRMAGAVAHHFNNILGAVIGNLELAIEETPMDSEKMETLVEANQAAFRAAELSSLLLTYLGQSFAPHTPLNLTDTCKCSLSALENVVRNNVILKTELETQGHLISGNAAQIKEVLKNLVTNASEAIGNSQGIIQITVSQVTSTEIRGIYRYPVDWELQETVYACLEVKDTGTGIASNDIQQIFDPFFSSKFTGRGLGLPVVLGIVRAHNGGITVESELNKGSAFRVYFPLATQSKPSHRDEDATPSEMQWGGMVLLVDDDEHIRKMSKNMLKHIGFSTLAARDGIEAVEMFRKHQDSIRIVICDLTMPHMNGWETIDALRNLSSDIPVILVSGYDEAHAMHRCNQDNSVMFLHKPYSISDLRGALQNIFQANVNEG